MRLKPKQKWLPLAALALVLFLFQGAAMAAPDFFLYGNQGTGDIDTVDGPTIETGSYFTAIDYFRDGSDEGKRLAATGRSIYIETGVGTGSWTKVAEVDDNMDPAFLKISPSGDKVALGLGWGQDILVFDATVLDPGTPSNPVDLSSSNDVLFFSENHYDAAWAGENHLAINAGSWVIPGQSATAGVAVLDITDDTNSPVVVVGYVPGASSGVAVDDDFNLLFGNGYDYDTTDVSLTGEIRIWPADTWWTGTAPLGTLMTYLGTDNYRIANEVLSAAHLGFDTEGNLHVGGGQFVGVGGTTDENGYAALINKTVMSTALTDEADNLVDETHGGQYKELAPDVCQNDTAATVMANGRSLTIGWNPASSQGDPDCIPGGNKDYWAAGVTPSLTTYTINTTRDGDLDGFNDVDDTSPGTNHASNADTDGDGYGNIIDADFNNDDVVNVDDLTIMQGDWGDTTYPQTDMNSDGVVNVDDLTLLQNLWGAEAPYYDL